MIFSVVDVTHVADKLTSYFRSHIHLQCTHIDALDALYFFQGSCIYSFMLFYMFFA